MSSFSRLASNLVANDTNGKSDIFVRDRVANTTQRICDGVQGNGDSSTPAMSADGRLVAFASDASNLVANDTNRASDIFVCDRETGTITRVSVGPNGLQANCPDSSKAANCSILPAISSDGSVVGFKSTATNLVADDTNGYVDVFVYDRNDAVTERISVGAGGRNSDAVSFPPTLSETGRWVAFGSLATNLAVGDNMRVANVFVRDRLIGFTEIVDVGVVGGAGDSSTLDVTAPISNDGMRVAFVSLASNLSSDDTNQVADVFATKSPFFGPSSCPDGVCPVPITSAWKVSVWWRRRRGPHRRRARRRRRRRRPVRRPRRRRSKRAIRTKIVLRASTAAAGIVRKSGRATTKTRRWIGWPASVTARRASHMRWRREWGPGVHERRQVSGLDV